MELVIAAKMKLTETILSECFENAKKIIKETLNLEDGMMTQIDHNCYIAGTSIWDIHHSREPKDIDIFFCKKVLAEKIKKMAKPENNNDYRVVITDNAITIINYDFGTPIQLIICNAGCPENVLSNFDFDHTRFWFMDGRVRTIKDSSFEQLNSTTLSIDKASKLSLKSIVRATKFINRGCFSNTSDAFILQIMQKIEVAKDSEYLNITDDDLQNLIDKTQEEEEDYSDLANSFQDSFGESE